MVQNARRGSSMNEGLAPTSVYMTAECSFRGEGGENEDEFSKLPTQCKRTSTISPISRPARLRKDSGVPRRAVCFFTSFHCSGYAGFHVVHRLVRAASPSLSCRRRTIQTPFHCAGDVLTCVLSRGRGKKQCKKRAYPNPNRKCSELV